MRRHLSHRLRISALIVVGSLLIPAACVRAQEADGEGAEAPKVKLPDPQAELSQIRVPAGFKAELFAAEPRLRHPSAFCIDEKGRFFVVEADRRKNGTLDMRQLASWVEEDLSSRTVADRIAMVKRHYQEGSKQLASMTAKSDRIRLLEDRDGDGKADFDTVFADGFNRLENGTAAGVLAWRGNVYFTEIPDLWLLRDHRETGQADFRKSLAHGFGVHYTYSGHDMHGLRIGPDGRLYWSIADRGAAVEKDGKVVINNPDSGAVFRCEPDGSNVELFATGLRNPQELAFDRYGNLFTGDNNSDAGDATRWVYVVEGGDSGWRTPYQYHDFPVSRGLWMAEKLWEVNPAIPANYRLPPIANPKIAGPAGLTYNPGTGMPAAFDDCFLLVDFRGGPANSGIYALKNKPSGASFELVEAKEVVGGVLPTDVEFGYTGGFYLTSWVNGWDPLGQGRIYHVFDPETAKSPAVADTRQLMAEGMARRKPDELAKLLGHPDMRVRLEAQFALADKGTASVPTFVAQVKQTGSQLARIHAVWGLGQIGRRESNGSEALAALLPLLEHGDAEVRAQASKTLADAKYAPAYDAFVKGLRDRNARVQFFSAMGVAKLIDRPARDGSATPGQTGARRSAAPDPAPGITARPGAPGKDALPQVLAMLKRNNDRDAYLRHAGVMALVAINDLPALQKAAQDGSAAVRLAVLLAYRRMQRPEVAQFLSDTPELVLEAARAVNDLPISDALPQLADLLNKPTNLDEPLRTPVLARALNANYRLGTPPAAAAVAAFASRPDAPAVLRVEALRMLGNWDKPPARDRVSALYRPLPERDAGIAKAALEPVLPQVLEKAPVRVKVAALNAALATGLQTAPLFDIVSDATAAGEYRAAALGAMAQRKDSKLAEAVKLALADADEAVRVAAIRLQPKQGGGLEPLKQLLESGTPREQQAVLQALGEVKERDKGAKAADAMLVEAFDRMAAGTLAPEAQLDLLDAAATRKKGEVAGRLKRYDAEQKKAAAADPLSAYRAYLVGGDARAGETIFRERQDVSCMRCHSVRGAGGNTGPDLVGVAKRAPGSQYHSGREYILESILYPNKKIAPGFETVTIRTTDGDSVAGLFKGEDDKVVMLDVPNQGLLRVEKAKIKTRQGGMSAMPDDIARTLSKKDLRDLVEFLANQ